MAKGIAGWGYFRVFLFGEVPPNDCDVRQEVGNLLRVNVGGCLLWASDSMPYSSPASRSVIGSV